MNSEKLPFSFSRLGLIEASVVRRSFMLMVFVAPALLLNFALSVLAARWLEAEQFGQFFVALSLASILTAPSAILTFFFARHFVQMCDSDRGALVWTAYRHFMMVVVRWAAVAGVVAWLVLALLGEMVGTKSLLLISFAVGLSYVHFVADTARALLQGLGRFVTLGGYTLGWMSLRFVLAFAAIAYLGSVWAGLAGVGISGVVIFVLFLLVSGVGRRDEPPDTGGRKDDVAMPRFGSLVGFSTGYSFFLRFPFSTSSLPIWSLAPPMSGFMQPLR